jgi:hypothetical protein
MGLSTPIKKPNRKRDRAENSFFGCRCLVRLLLMFPVQEKDIQAIAGDNRSPLNPSIPIVVILCYQTTKVFPYLNIGERLN